MNVITALLILWLLGWLVGYAAAELNWGVWRERQK